MNEIPKPDYSQLIEQSGIPTTAQQWQQTLRDEMKKEGVLISNDSRFSPFWRLIESCVITATTYLINKVLVGKVLPNSFLATAVDDELDLMGWECQTERKLATKTQGTVVFLRAINTTTAIAIPKNTWIQTAPINGKTYRVKTLVDAALEEGQTTVEVEVEAEEAGAAFNLGGGYFSILPQAIAGVASVTNEDDWINEAGQDIETNDDYRLRIRAQWGNLAKWHVDAAYKSLLMKESGLQHDNVFFQHGAPRGAGSANALILMKTGEPSEDMIQRLNDLVMKEGNHGHGDDLLVMPMPSTKHAISAKWWAKPELTDEARAALQKQIEDFVRCAFRENLDYPATATQPTGRFSFSRLEGELHQFFDGLDSIRFAQDDIISNLTIARLESLELVLQ